MLQTVEAIYDPQKGLAFSEAVNVTAPIKVWVTFAESSRFLTPKKGSAQALLNTLKMNSLPQTAQVSDADIDAQIQEISQSWES
ncbi:MAG: hypothetical protein WCL34_15600 [Methylococcaceae bacterium]|jgi:hypothetical protein